MGNLVEVLAVSISGLDDRLVGRSIDVPAAGQHAEARSTDIVGWVIGRDVPAVAVELLQGDRVIGRSRVRFLRPDVTARFAGVPGNEAPGFQLSANLSGTDE